MAVSRVALTVASITGWNESGEKDRSLRVAFPADVEDRGDWDNAIRWLCRMAARLRALAEDFLPGE